MMKQLLLKIEIRHETDIVHSRQVAREIARNLRMDPQEQIRLATAISEITRNIYQYAQQGVVQFLVEKKDEVDLVIIASDKGPGIPRLKDILNGTYISPHGMGIGISGTRKLVDFMDIHTEPGKGTTVTLRKRLRGRLSLLSQEEINDLLDALIQKDPSPLNELQKQNQDILQAMSELNAKKEELAQLNQELENTNRGVVALYAELDEKAESLRVANETKTSFLADMTHEFRAPLNSILSISQLISSDAKSENNQELQKQMGFIMKAAQGLSDLVNDLLDISKIEAGKISVKASAFSVHDLFGAIRGLMKPLNHNEQVQLIFQEDAPIHLISDEPKISQILRNLISNALKYTESGTVIVSAIEINDHVIFSVVDTGIGIPPEHLESIFEEFTQVDNPLQKKQRGTGLGLPLSKKLARLLSGTIEVDSVMSKGSAFSLKIPLTYKGPLVGAYHDLEEKKKQIRKSSSPKQISSNKKVLVIDDEESSRYAISRSLENLEIDYLEATNGVEGMERTRSFMPDLIILDLTMPQKDGFEFLQDCLSNKNTRNIPVIVHTSHEMEDEERDYLEQVCYLILEKKSDKTELREAVKNKLFKGSEES